MHSIRAVIIHNITSPKLRAPVSSKKGRAARWEARIGYDFDANTPLKQILPRLVSENRGRYERLGLKDLAEEMSGQMRELKTGAWLEQAFAILPKPVCTPVRAYEQLVLGHVEKVALKELAGRIIATGIVPYPPGIPLLMPGEAVGRSDGPALGYLGALEAFDRQFPGFAHDIHGVEVKDGRYYALCLTNPGA